MNVIETRVLELIGESVESPDVFTDDSTGMAPIRDSINDAIEEISMLTGCCERTFQIPLQDSMMFYRVTSNRDIFAYPKSVWLVDQKRRIKQKDLVWLEHYNPRFLYNTGTPERYILVGDDIIGVHPVPSSDTDMLEVNAVVIPDRYTSDTDRIKLRDSLKWATVHFAVSEYYAGRGDAKSAFFHHGEYLKKLGIAELYPELNDRVWELKTEKDK